MVCLGSDYESSWSKLPKAGPNSKMTKSLVVEVVRVTTEVVLQTKPCIKVSVNLWVRFKISRVYCLTEF